MNRKQKWILALAIILLGASIAGKFSDFHFFESKAPVNQTEVSPLDPPKSDSKKELSDARNTAIVQAVKKVSPAVVGITTKVYDRDIFNRKIQVGEGVGSGFIFDTKGYIVTNQHVVGQARDVSVSLSDGRTVTGHVVGTDSRTDLAVVKIDAPNLTAAPLGDSDSLAVGEPAIAIGNPLGLEFQGSVTSGIISAFNRQLDASGQALKLIQTDAAINPGNSGGALVNADGEVIGINSAKISKAGIEGLGFAIPINAARPIIKELIEKGKVVRPYLGLYGVDKKLAARYGYDFDRNGVLVVQVGQDSPLEEAGIERGDLIVQFNGQNITSFADLEGQMQTLHVGDHVAIAFVRDGHTYDGTVVLGENSGE